jgi:hypothetical protein
MEKTLEVHFQEYKDALLAQIDKINAEEAKLISSDYYAATIRLKMVFRSIIEHTKPPM